MPAGLRSHCCTLRSRRLHAAQQYTRSTIGVTTLCVISSLERTFASQQGAQYGRKRGGIDVGVQKHGNGFIEVTVAALIPHIASI